MYESEDAAIEDALPLREIPSLRVEKFKSLIKEKGLDLTLCNCFTVAQSELVGQQWFDTIFFK